VMWKEAGCGSYYLDISLEELRNNTKTSDNVTGHPNA